MTKIIIIGTAITTTTVIAETRKTDPGRPFLHKTTATQNETVFVSSGNHTVNFPIKRRGRGAPAPKRVRRPNYLLHESDQRVYFGDA